MVIVRQPRISKRRTNVYHFRLLAETADLTRGTGSGLCPIWSSGCKVMQYPSLPYSCSADSPVVQTRSSCNVSPYFVCTAGSGHRAAVLTMIIKPKI